MGMRNMEDRRAEVIVEGLQIGRIYIWLERTVANFICLLAEVGPQNM